MKGNTLFLVSCIATVSNNTSSLHSAMILTHTIVCWQTFFSEKKTLLIPEMMSEANSSHSPLFLGREHGNVQNYKL